MQSAMKRTAGLLALALVVVLAAAPVLAQDDDEALERRVSRLENILEGDQLVELIDRITALENQVRELRGAVEEQRHRLDELRDRQRNLYGDLDDRLRELELALDRGAVDDGDGGDGGETAPAPETTEQAAEAPVTDAEGSDREDYQAAFDMLREGRYDAAARAFSQFLEAHPDSGYAANARYWLGEAHYVTRDFEAARAAFEQVREDHPQSNKAGDALLKIGFTQYEQEDYAAARETLQQVQQQYPDSAVARLAEDRLARMAEEGN